MKATFRGVRHSSVTGKPFEMELHEALEPGQYSQDGAAGALETLSEGLDSHSEAFGRLLAWMVEHRGMTHDEASQIAHGRPGLVEEVAPTIRLGASDHSGHVGPTRGGFRVNQMDPSTFAALERSKVAGAPVWLNLCAAEWPPRLARVEYLRRDGRDVVVHFKWASEL